MKKLLPVILILCMLLCHVPVSAEQAGIKTAFDSAAFLCRGDFPENSSSAADYRIAPFSAASFETDVGITDIHKYIRDRLTEMSPEIPLEDYGITAEQLKEIYEETVNYYPELFQLNNRYSYYYRGDLVVSLLPEYVMTSEEYAAALKEYYAEIDYIISGTAPLESDIEKALYVHDYLVSHACYDETYSVYDAYNFLTGGSGVCQAYTLAFSALMHRLGIESVTAVNGEKNHTWNIIEINRKFYHIDCTFDDPLGQSAGSVSHDYFLLSGNTVNSRDSHGDWTTNYDSIDSGDSTYENGYAWNEADSGIVFSGGYWYYVKNTGGFESSLIKTSDLIESESIESFFSALSVSDKPGYYYVGYYGGITAAGTDIYYTAPSEIRRYDTLTGKSGKLSGFSSDTPVSSCRYDGGGILNVYFSAVPANYDDLGSASLSLFPLMGDSDGDGAVSAPDLAAAEKYLLSGEASFNWAVLDVSGNIGVDIIDQIKNKKSAALIQPGV